MSADDDFDEADQSTRRAPLMRRSRLIWVWILAALLVLVILLNVWSNLWTDKLWFDSVGYSSVFRTELTSKVLLFLLGGLIAGGLIYGSQLLAYRRRPIYAPSTPELETMDRYRELLEPFRKVSFVAVPVFFGLFAGSIASSQWQTALLWLNRTPFGQTDPQFHKDLGFFVFTLPWLEFLVSFLTLALILALIAALVTHYIYGGISIGPGGVHVSPIARIQLGVLFAVLILVRGVAYWLARYAQTTADTRKFTGMDYTGEHAVLPTKAILAFACLLCAALFIAAIWTRTWRLPVIALAMLVVVAVGLGGIYPALMDSFRVQPNAQTLQSRFISQNMAATRAAYGLTDVATTQYNPVQTTRSGQLSNDSATVGNIRLMDPSVVSPTFQQLQGSLNYYQFQDSLDVDRYQVDGQNQDTVVGVRELDLSKVPAAQRNWVNEHTVYTHGYGVVAAKGNSQTVNGEPVFIEKDMPSTGALSPYEARVYFGESSPEYSIVSATGNRELDYPTDGSGSGEQRTSYKGSGGVDIGNPINRFAYALKYREINFLLTDAIGSTSKLLDNRNPVDRVKKVAPWLTVDGDPYPVVVDGRVKWIVDGYTTTARYPNSEMTSLGDATSDSVTATASNVRGINAGQVNYIRNSVKATVDAYDGSITLYAWDESDPILKTWSKAFGGTVKPLSAISGSLMAHMRYPEDLFKVQRELMAKYHVSTASDFFSGGDFWSVPDDPTQGSTNAQQPPYYLSMAMPGESTPTFSLTTNFVPVGDTKNNLTAFMAVDANAGSTAGQKSSTYGKFKILKMPSNATVTGPQNFQNQLRSSSAYSASYKQTLSQFITSNTQSSASIVQGNLLTVPVGGGVLYVEPLYVKSTSSTPYPLLRAVVVGFGKQVAWGATLQEALNTLFGGSSGATAGDAAIATDSTGSTSSGSGDGDGGSGSTATPTPTPTPSTSGSNPPATGNRTLPQVINEIQQTYDQSEAALKAGDWTAYGAAQEKLKTLIAEAEKLSTSSAAPSTK